MNRLPHYKHLKLNSSERVLDCLNMEEKLKRLMMMNFEDEDEYEECNIFHR